MAFQQLYYTSCEQGLSGYAGYQFNAVTPGVHPEVMREVERLTAYEPPRSVPHRPTEEEIAGCPVALRFDGGNTTIVANVVFVGADYSMRYGNYFAHALVTANPSEDLGAVLPIELWHASFWVSKPVESPELPPLTGPLPHGRFDRGLIQAFVRRHAAAQLLPSLLSAVAHTVHAQDRSVVLLHSDTDVVAQWIAAVSYLLPPPIVHRMSFTTYHHRPSYCQLHVIGTHPDADVDIASAFTSFYLFDLEGVRSTQFQVHPLATLLTDVGMAGAADLWAQAQALATGGEVTLDDWHSVALAAGAVVGRQLSTDELDVTIDWLAAESARIGPEHATTVCEALLAQPALRAEHLRALAATAAGANAGALLDEAEIKRADTELAQALGGQDQRAIAAFASPRARDHAVRRCAAMLRQADMPTAIRLLSWAAEAGLRLPERALESCGADVVGPFVLGMLEEPPPEDLGLLLQRWPPLRAGLIAYLAGTPADAVVAAFDRGLHALVKPAQLAAHPDLHELALISAARGTPERRMRLLKDILDLRGRGKGADHDLLMRLWPEGTWSMAEARDALRILNQPDILADAVPQWLSRALIQGAHLRDASLFEEYLRVSRQLETHPVRDCLSAQARDCLGWTRWVDEQLAKVAKTSEHAGIVAQGMLDRYDDAPAPVQDLIVERLPGLLAGIGLPTLIDLLSACPEPALQRYIEQVRPSFGRGHAKPALAATLFRVVHQLAEHDDQNGAVLEDRLLRQTLPEWKRRDIEALKEELARIGMQEALAFQTWLTEEGKAHTSKRFPFGRRLKK